MQQIAILEAEGSALRFQVQGEYNEDDIGAAVEGLIDLLDKRFAPFDPDEPDFSRHSDALPGDPDDAEPDDDAKGDPAWVEWGTRGRHKQRLGAYEMIISRHEDDEDDDPAEEDDPSGQCSEDEISCGPGSWGALERAGPGCDLSDPGGGDNGY